MVALEASKLFCQLTPPELNALRRVVREQTYAAGREIFKEGDNGDGVYVVRDGLWRFQGWLIRRCGSCFPRSPPGTCSGRWP
jgi:hypothetical protein